MKNEAEGITDVYSHKHTKKESYRWHDQLITFCLRDVMLQVSDKNKVAFIELGYFG